MHIIFIILLHKVNKCANVLFVSTGNNCHLGNVCNILLLYVVLYVCFNTVILCQLVPVPEDVKPVTVCIELTEFSVLTEQAFIPVCQSAIPKLNLSSLSCAS